MSKIEDFTFEEKQQALGEAWEIIQGGSVKVHEFSCDNEHLFYMNMYLPRPTEEIVEILGSTVCPICQNEKILISAEEMRVVNDL